jgi:multiple sugar transport system substrate-binding protein
MKIVRFVLLFWLASFGCAAATDITVLYPQPYLYQAPLEAIVHAFAEKHPDIQIKLLAPTKSYEEAASAVLRSAVTRTIPDIVFNGTNLMHIFVDRNLAVSLEPFVKAEIDWEKQGYVPAMVSTGKVNGALYGMPFALSTPIMYYNTDLLAKAGGDAAAPPRTWPEAIALGAKISALGGDTKGMFIAWQTTGNYLWQDLLFSNGGKLLSADGRQVGFNTPQGLETFKILHDMVVTGGMPNYTDEQATQAFAAGKIGMFFSSSARVNAFTKQIGGRFGLRTAAFPAPTPDSPLVSGGAEMMIFTRDAAKQKAAWEFIKFAAGPVGQTIMVKHIGYMPSNQIAVDTPDLLGDYYAANANMRTAISLLPRATRWLGFPGDNSLKAIDVIYNGIESVIAQSATPEAALAAVSSQVQALLPK